MIKIDVEGAEGLVFQGMIETIKKHQPVMIMEYTPQSLADVSGIPGEDLLKAFEELGYGFQDVESFQRQFTKMTVRGLKFLLKKGRSKHLDLLLFPNSLEGSSNH